MDCDMLMYAACSVAEQCIEWEPDFTTIYTELTDAKAKFLSDLSDYTKRALRKLHQRKDYSYIMCISDTDNFRKLVLPTYKSGRTNRKPCGYKFLKDWVRETYESITYPLLEADDCIGILGNENTCILSGDKDMKTLPGKFYHFLRDEFYETSKEEALYHWYYQTLLGDSTDGYKGCPGVGDKGARKLLDTECSWSTVVGAYEAKGLTEEDALLQARVARILQPTDYNTATGEIYLWNPNGSPDTLCPPILPVGE